MKMKKFIPAILAIAVASMGQTACAGSSASGSSFDLKDLLNTGGNLLEGVFTTGNIEVKDLAGEWTSSGSAVSFKSENALKKAGGVAVAAAVEAKLDPYFKQYGLTGSTMKIESDGQFTFTVKKLKMSGVITKRDDGNFTFTFKALGSMSLPGITAYVAKGPKNLDIMFDASKLQELVTFIGKLSGTKTVQAVGSILNSYDGICVGFKMSKTGGASDDASGSEGDSSTQESVKSGLEKLKGLLNKGE